MAIRSSSSTQVMKSKLAPRTSPFAGSVPHVQGNRRLREPQVEAFQALEEHFAESDEPALVQLPVGCGKTGLMAMLPFGLSKQAVDLVATLLRTTGIWPTSNICGPQPLAPELAESHPAANHSTECST